MEITLVWRYPSVLQRYYRSYTGSAELILVLQILFLYFGSYTCISDLILVLRILYLYYGFYTCLKDFILVLRSLFFSCRSYTCISDKEVPVGTTEHFTCTKVLVGTTQIYYTEVPVGTTGLILILQNLYLFFRYESTHGYYKDYSDTGVHSDLYSCSLFSVLSYVYLTT